MRKLVTRLWDEYEIKPVIDIRNTWKDPDPTRRVPDRENVTYDWSGTIRCMCPAMHTEREMAFGGFEADRMTLKYRCPARHYGYECHGMHRCPIRSSVRIPLSTNRRIFTPMARSSYRWKTLYRRRTALERINSRIEYQLRIRTPHDSGAGEDVDDGHDLVVGDACPCRRPGC